MPLKLPPYRTPMAVSDAIKEHIQDKVVCELGCAEGDNMEFMARYAKQVIGFELNPNRYPLAKQRGLDVTVGDYYKDPIPEAEVYYFWPDDGERDSEYLVQKLLQRPGFKGKIIIGGDPGFPPEIPSLHRCAKLGRLIEVPYNEGLGHRQNGIYHVVVIDADTLPQQLVLVLSSPRAGSSATTGSLQICGMSLGQNITTVKDKHNAKGYFENQNFLTFNEQVLKTVGTSIFATTPLNTIQILKSLEFKDELVALFKSEFGTAKFMALKDPRMNILQTLYDESFKELGYKVKGIILSRPEEQAVSSMTKMTGIAITTASKSYKLHYQLAERFMENHLITRFSFAELIDNPNDVMKKTHFDLEIPYGIGRYKKQELSQFVERRLIHHGK